MKWAAPVFSVCVLYLLFVRIDAFEVYAAMRQIDVSLLTISLCISVLAHIVIGTWKFQALFDLVNTPLSFWEILVRYP